MSVLHPVIVSGEHIWDRGRLPIDEFRARASDVIELMRGNQIGGLIIHGNAQQSDLITYLSNYIPRMRWAVALLDMTGALHLYVAGPTRDLHFLEPLTHAAGIKSFETLATDLPQWLATVQASGFGVGLAGYGSMRPDVKAALGRHVSWAALQQLDGGFDSLMARKRPREVRALARCCGQIQSELTDLKSRCGADVRGIPTAILETERRCLTSGGYHVSTLFSVDGGATLVPLVPSGIGTPSASRSAAYLAFRSQGYWAEGMTSIGPSLALDETVVECLDAALAIMTPGNSVKAIYEAIDEVRAGADWHPFTVDPVSQLGLSIRPCGIGDILLSDSIYSLKVGLAKDSVYSFGSAVAKPGLDGAQVMLRL